MGKELTKVNLKNLKTGEIIPIDTEYCFLFIGYIPNTDIYKGIVNMTDRGYILTDENMRTNCERCVCSG